LIVKFGQDKVKAEHIEILASGDILMKSLEFHPRFGFGHHFLVPQSDLVDKLPKDFFNAVVS